MDFAAIVFVMFVLIGGGIRTLVNGRIQATKTSVVEGFPARLVGMLLLLSIPLSIAAFSFHRSVLKLVEVESGGDSLWPLLLGVLPLVACPLLAVLIGFCAARPMEAPAAAPNPLMTVRPVDADAPTTFRNVTDDVPTPSESGESAVPPTEEVPACSPESHPAQPELPRPGFWGALGLMLVMGLGVGVCLAPVMVGIGHRDFQSHSVLLLSVNGVAILGVAIAIALKLFGARTRRILALRSVAIFHLLLIVLLTPALALLAVGFANWAVPPTNVQNVPDFPSFEFRHRPAAMNEPFGEQVFGDLSQRSWLAILVLGCLLPALGEEIFCRGILGRGLVARYGLVPGVLVTSVLFGVMHLEPGNIIGATMLGIGCHVLLLTTKSLLAPIVLHALNNSLAFGAEKMEDWGVAAMLNSDGTVPFPLWLTAFAAVAGLFALFYQSRVRWILPDGSPWQPGYLTAEMPDACLSAEPRRGAPKLGAAAFAFVGYAAFGGFLALQSGLNPASFHASFSRGSTAYDRGDYDAAIAEYSAAIAADPKWAVAYDARGLALTMNGRAGDAIADFNEAIRLEEKTASFRANRAWAWNQMAEFDRAIEDSDRAIRLDPKDHFAHSVRGQARSRRWEYDLALKDFDRAIRLNPKDANSYQLRAGVRFAMQEYEKALQDYESALEIDPGDTFSKAQRDSIVENRELFEGNAHYFKGEFGAAIAIYDRVLREKPLEQTARANRGMARMKTGDYAGAIADLDLVAADRPPDDPARVSRTIAYYRTGRLIDAKRDFDEAAELLAEKPAHALYYARTLMGDGIWAGALPVLDRAAAADRDSGAILAARGSVLRNLGEFRRAAADLEAALQRTPTLHGATYDLIWIRAACPIAELRDGPKAVKLARGLVDADKLYPAHSLSALAAAEAECGNFDEAIRRQEEAVKQSKSDREFHEYLLELFRSGEPYRMGDNW